MRVQPANRVLELLYDRREGYVSLEELSSAVGLDRPRLDRALDDLRRRGHEMEFSPSFGLRLSRPVKLDAHLIERDLGTRRVGRSAICFDRVCSTNDVAFDSARQGDTDGLVVLAESQSSGRGRHGRRWIGPPGENILLSVLLIGSRAPAHEALTIAAGLAVAEGIEAACDLACRLKWPNDVLLDDRKVAGVLVEVRRLGGVRCMVVGAGINANAAPPDERVDWPATDLAAHLGRAVERIEVLRAVLRRLDHWVGRISGGQYEQLRTAWMRRCGMINRRVTVLCGTHRHVGRVLEVSPLDGLMLCCDDGTRVHLPADSSTVLE